MNQEEEFETNKAFSTIDLGLELDLAFEKEILMVNDTLTIQYAWTSGGSINRVHPEYSLGRDTSLSPNNHQLVDPSEDIWGKKNTGPRCFSWDKISIRPGAATDLLWTSHEPEEDTNHKTY